MGSETLSEAFRNCHRNVTNEHHTTQQIFSKRNKKKMSFWLKKNIVSVSVKVIIFALFALFLQNTLVLFPVDVLENLFYYFFMFFF